MYYAGYIPVLLAEKRGAAGDNPPLVIHYRTRKSFLHALRLLLAVSASAPTQSRTLTCRSELITVALTKASATVLSDGHSDQS